jgi:AcrR family transcriptional regulator
MVDLVGTHAYDDVTVRALTRRAGVSSRAFYGHFDSKEDCFLQTYERVVRRVVKLIIAAQAGEPDWRKRLRLAFQAFVRELAREPHAARLALIEVYGVGQEARKRVRRTEAMFEAMIAESFSRAPDGVSMPPVVIKGLVAGVARVSRARLLQPGSQDLTGLGEELAEWCLSYYSDAVQLLPGHRPSLTPLSDFEAEDGRSLIDNRALILAAVVKLIAANESDHLTMSEIRTATGLSRSAFTNHFANVEECLIAAKQLETRRIVSRSLAQSTGTGSWANCVDLALACLCRQLANDADLAKVCIDDLSASGVARVRAREYVMDELTSLVGDVADVGLEASVGAIWGVIRQAARAESPPQLTRRAPVLSFFALAPQIGANCAVEAIRGSGRVVSMPALERESEKMENAVAKSLTAARDGVMLDGARDDLVTRA